MNGIKRFIWETDAATAVEYAFVLILIFGAVLATVVVFGQATSDNLNDSSDHLKTALNN